MPADVSYGAYIWAFPVQQTAAMLGAGVWWLNLALSLPVILILAIGSWWIVERPALHLRTSKFRRRPATLSTEQS
jgi:peptidoglycan/LPS O-acetylase OafA/YrhL